jgi:bacterial/archaeal transporter family-2 protein
VNATTIAFLLVLLSGSLLAIQAPVNATLSRAVGGPINASLISFLVGTAALTVTALALRAQPSMPAVRALPWWAWCGGLCGAVFVSTAAFAAPKLGVATLLTLGVASQLASAIVLDHFGAFGIARQAITSGRLIGVALVVAGAVLVRRG